MSIINLPTDSVYKLIAIFGAVLILFSIYNIYNWEDNLEQLRLEKDELTGILDTHKARVQTEAHNTKKVYARVCRLIGVPDSCCIYTATETKLYPPTIVDEVEFTILKDVSDKKVLNVNVYAENVKSGETIKKFKDSIPVKLYPNMAKTALKEYKESSKEHYQSWMKYNLARQEATYKLEHHSKLISVTEEKINRLKVFNVLTLLIGLCITIIGFYLWYHKIQKYEDIKIKN